MGYEQRLSPGRKRLRHRGTFYRLIRTTQEHRAWDAEYGRPARSHQRLVEYRDEVIRFPERTWKRHRATQYKPVVIVEMPAAR